MRDRVVVLGERAQEPTDVASLDEVLFMIPRRVFRHERLSERPELAWHAYAVEYGLRVRARGMRVCAVDIPLTHNSLTLNVERLNVAYEAVAEAHPGGLPLRTTCGTVTARPRRRPRIVSSHGWRYRWLRESLAVHAARRASGGGACVLGDIRMDIDELIAASGPSPLLVLNLDEEGNLLDGPSDPLELVRDGRQISVSLRDTTGVTDAVAEAKPGTSVLVTNLDRAALRELGRRLPPARACWDSVGRSAIGWSWARRRRRRRLAGGCLGRGPSRCPRPRADPKGQASGVRLQRAATQGAVTWLSSGASIFSSQTSRQYE